MSDELWSIANRFIAKPFATTFLVLGVAITLLAFVEPSNVFPYFIRRPDVVFFPLLIAASFFLVAVIAVFTFEKTERKTDNVKSLIFKDLDKRITFKQGSIQDVYEIGERNCVLLPCDDKISDQCLENRSSSLGSFLHHNRLTDAAKAARRKKLGSSFEAQAIGSSIMFSENGINCIISVNSNSRDSVKSRLCYSGQVIQSVPNSLDEPNFEKVFVPVLGAGHANLEKRLALSALVLFAHERLRISSTKEFVVAVFVDGTGKPELSIQEQTNVLAAMSRVLGNTAVSRG